MAGRGRGMGLEGGGGSGQEEGQDVEGIPGHGAVRLVVEVEDCRVKQQEAVPTPEPTRGSSDGVEMVNLGTILKDWSILP